MAEPVSQIPASQPAPPFEPVVFGKYVLVDRIAAGGMAEIFKAKTFSHGGFENLVVIKRILPHIGENPEFVEMFQDEARVSVQLQHPNIVRIYDFGKYQQNWYIVMECVDGKDVRNLLRAVARRREFLPAELCAYIALETAKGLRYAHDKTDLDGKPYGIVHRDVSPSNVLISYDGEVKVADFGIAKAESNAYQTQEGTLKGKFEYMSPEQARGVSIDHRSDLFSLGIVLWETLTGRRLFRSESEAATLERVKTGQVEPPGQFRPDVPPRLAEICMKALSVDLGVRHAHAGELEEELRAFLLPETPDTLKVKARAFLQGIFAEEQAAERARLVAGEAAARKLKDKLPQGDWDGAPDSTMSSVTQTAVQAVVPWIAAASVGLFLLGGLALAAVVFLVWSRPPPEAPRETVVVSQPSDRTILDITVFPAAKVLVDGQERGSGTSVTLEDVPPGPHVVRIEAEGHTPVEQSVTVEEGRITKVVQQLQPMKGKATEPEPKAAPTPKTPAPEPEGPPVVELRSSPAGASVVIEGDVICTTPCSWDGGREGDTVVVEMRLAGRQTERATVRSLKAGTQRVSLTLPELAGPATLTVTLLGGGWANVYVDGKKLPKTAPFKELEVPAGSHEVRAENPAAGLDVTQRHTFEAGKTTTLRFETQR